MCKRFVSHAYKHSQTYDYLWLCTSAKWTCLKYRNTSFHVPSVSIKFLINYCHTVNITSIQQFMKGRSFDQRPFVLTIKLHHWERLKKEKTSYRSPKNFAAALNKRDFSYKVSYFSYLILITLFFFLPRYFV
jgi:hypothetical protein